MISPIYVGPLEIFRIISRCQSPQKSVKKALLINEKKTISAIMDEIKNMLDYKTGCSISNKKSIPPSFMFIKQKFFRNGGMDKLKTRLVPDYSQQMSRNLYDFISSPYKWYIF